MRFVRDVLAIPLLLLTGCDSLWEGEASRRALVSEDGDTAFLVAADDPELNQARHEARCTVDELVRRFLSPPPTQTDLALKATFREEGQVEHLWLRLAAIQGDSLFTGVIDNDVLVLTGLEHGDTVVVHRSSISDWFAVDRDSLIGGFSIRAFRNRRTDAEREQMDREAGYAVGDDLENWRRLPKRCM